MSIDAGEDENRYTILHVDHDLTELARLRVMLGTFTHLRCLSSPCALIGLEIARFRHPDLILLDIDSPAVDLAGMLAELGRDPRTRDIPVIAVSADHAGLQAAALPPAADGDDDHHPCDMQGCDMQEHPPAGGLCGILRKPLSDAKLLRILGSACQPRALRQGQAEA